MSAVARPTPQQSPATPHILDNAAWAALPAGTPPSPSAWDRAAR